MDQFKITLQFDGHHVGSVWCDGYETTPDTITAWTGDKWNTMFVMYCNDNSRTYKVWQYDKVICSSEVLVPV